MIFFIFKYNYSICRKTSENFAHVRKMHHRVHYMPFLAYSQSHVTDKFAGSIVSTLGIAECDLASRPVTTSNLKKKLEILKA